MKHFWNLWRKHYLVELREHHSVKGRVTGWSSIINVRDIVTVQEEGFWKIGKIVKLIKGHDDIVRGAEVRICSKGRKPITVKRPVQKLFPMEIRDRQVKCEVEEKLDIKNIKGSLSKRDAKVMPLMGELKRKFTSKLIPNA